MANQENPPLKSRDNEERCRHDDIACSNVHVSYVFSSLAIICGLQIFLMFLLS